MVGIAFRKIRKSVSQLLALALIVAAFAPVVPASTADAAEDTVSKMFSSPQEIGTMVTTPSSMSSAFGIEDGKQVMYTTVRGQGSNPALFNVVDLEDYGLIRTLELVDGGQSWGHEIDSQGNVYITAGSTLYRYSPVTKEVERLGTVPGAGALYNMAIDDQDVVYGGTYGANSSDGDVFKYDPATDQISVYEDISPGQAYIRSIVEYDGYVYAGTGTRGELHKLDPDTGDTTYIPYPENDLFASENPPELYSMTGVRNLLFVFAASGVNALFIYDMDAQQWLPEIQENFRGMFVSPELDGKIYFTKDGLFHSFDLETYAVEPFDMAFTSYVRDSGWIEVEGDPELPGKSLMTNLYNGAIGIFNFTTGVVKSWQPVIPGNPVSIQSLEFGPDGLLYSTGYQGSYGTRYNIETGDKELFSMGQSEGMTPLGDNMYFGEYPGARIQRLDTTQPIERGVNPIQVHDIGGDQDRPFAMTSGDGMLFAGTIPKGGKLGGSFTVFDGTDWTEYHDRLGDHSVMGLAYKDGLLYGSTTVWGGLDTEPTATKAKMFVWDVANEQMVAEFEPDVDQEYGIGPKAIGSLSFGPDGLLWAAARGTIFAVDPDTYEVVKQKEIYPTTWNADHYWSPVKLRWDDDGILYTTLDSKVVVINPETLAHTTIPGTITNLMTLGPDGNIYYSYADILYTIEVTEGVPKQYERTDVEIENNSFEQVNENGSIPGWESFGYVEGAAEYEISDEQATDGTKSLKIVDTETDAEAGVISIPFAVEPGSEYIAKSDALLTEGSRGAIFAMKYFDADGNEIAMTPAPADYVEAPKGAWSGREFTSIAPDNAVTGKLVWFISKSWYGTVYVDNVELIQSMEVARKVPQELPMDNPGFEEVSEEEAIPGWNILDPETLTDQDATVTASTYQAKTGDRSLFVYDNETSLMVAVQSDNIPAVEGKSYTVTMDVYRTDNPEGRSSNRPIIQTMYYDAEGNETAAAPGRSLELTNAIAPQNQWSTVSYETVAQPGAESLAVRVVGAAKYVASVYVDNVKVSTLVEVEEPPAPVLAAGETTMDSVDLSWNDVGDFDYQIKYKRSAASSWLIAGDAASTDGDTYSATLTGLDAATSYDIKVVVSNQGVIAESNTIQAVTANAPIEQMLPVVNPGFEAPVVDGVIPGWNIIDAESFEGEAAAIEVSSEQVASGAQSLYLLDNETDLSVTIDSDWISVLEGRTYKVTMDVMRTDNPEGRSSNRPIIQTMYYDAEGNPTAAAPGRSLELKTAIAPQNEWSTVSYETVAQPGAEYLAVRIVGAPAYVASVYVDDVEVSTTVTEEESLNFQVATAPAAEVEEGSNVTFEASAKQDADIIVEENGEMVAEAVGAGPDTPVTVTIPEPALGDHEYVVYAMETGMGMSAKVELNVSVVEPVNEEPNEEDENEDEDENESPNPGNPPVTPGNPPVDPPVGQPDPNDRAEEVLAENLERIEEMLDGRPAAKYSISTEKLAEVLERFQESDESELEIEIEEEDEVVVVDLPLGQLISSGQADADFNLKFKTAKASYELPLDVMEGLDEDTVLQLEIEQLEEETTEELKQKGNMSNAQFKAPFVEFEVRLVDGDGNVTAVNDFGNTYVSRSLSLSEDVDLTSSTGVRYDPETETYSFVPTVFTVNEEGEQVATLKRTGNSIYTVIEYNKSFPDVDGHWAEVDIEKLASKLVVSGMSESEFAPQSSVTRAEFAAMLVRSLGLTASSASVSFTDVDSEDWFAGAVSAAVQAELVNGYEDGSFRANQTISRAEMAVMLANAAQFIEAQGDADTSVLNRFADENSIADWAKPGISLVVEAELMAGKGDNQFAPIDTATRAEAAAVIHRFLLDIGFI